MSDLKVEATPAAAKPQGMRLNGTVFSPQPCILLAHELPLTTKNRQAVARTEEGVPAGLWPDFIREAGKGQDSNDYDEDEGEGDEGREGG